MDIGRQPCHRELRATVGCGQYDEAVARATAHRRHAGRGESTIVLVVR